MNCSAKENILDPADGSVKYAKDAVVATLTTDANAKASVSDLYLGKYILQEKTPSTGYTLDTTNMISLSTMQVKVWKSLQRNKR